MSRFTRRRVRAVGALLLLVGVLLWGRNLLYAKDRVVKGRGARDFTSYFMAYRSAELGRDPYSMRQVTLTAREHGLMRVHPFFYPPPFLLTLTWTGDLETKEAYLVWVSLDVLASLGAVLVLILWWRPLHPLVPALLVLLLGLHTAIPNNYYMGQANHLVLVITLLGLWAEDRGRPVLGGLFLGMACMAKMSPALLVAWWLLHRRWTAVATSVVTALVLSGLVLPLVSLEQQVGFYTEVLPQFASGRYNGLTVPIDIFANHSIPNVLDQVFPSRHGPELSDHAKLGARLIGVALVGGMAVLFRKEPHDAFARAAQIATVTTVMLLLPVYTYEHHLVWAVPAMAVGLIAIVSRRVSWLWVPAIVAAILALALDLKTLKAWNHADPSVVYRESKFVALLVLGLTAAWLGRSRSVSGEPD